MVKRLPGDTQLLRDPSRSSGQAPLILMSLSADPLLLSGIHKLTNIPFQVCWIRICILGSCLGDLHAS